MSRYVWALADEEISEHLRCSEEGRAREWLAMLISTLQRAEQVRVFITLWAIWHARRKAIHEQIFQSPLIVHAFMERYIEELGELEEKGRVQQRVTANPLPPRWIPPPHGSTKINIDAVVGKNSGRGSVAAIARDEYRAFSWCFSGGLPGEHGS
jgi:hypothetical protein